MSRIWAGSGVHPAVIKTAIVQHGGMVGSDIRDEQIERLQNYYLEKGRHPREVVQCILKAVMQKPAYIPGPLAGLTALL